MSPQLLLVLIVAFVAASFAGLVTRKPLYYLPVYWVLGVVALLIGQVFGRAAGVTFLNVGSVELGMGLACNLAMFVGLRLAGLWYNQSRG
jgi:hypothetical protein